MTPQETSDFTLDAMASFAPVTGSAPVFANGSIEIIHGDCLDEMQKMGADQFDAVVTDPPYSSGGRQQAASRNVIEKNKNEERGDEWFLGDNMGMDTYIRWMRQIGREALRVTCFGGHAYVFTDWRQYTNLVTSWESVGWTLRNVIVWDKNSPVAMGSFWRNNHEWICVFAKGAPNALAHRKTYNVWRGRKEFGGEHPTEKPLALMEYIVGSLPRVKNAILDPFAGSGTTLQAAKIHGYRAVGIERADSYVKLCKAKCAQDYLTTGSEAQNK